MLYLEINNIDEVKKKKKWNGNRLPSGESFREEVDEQEFDTST